MSLYTNISNEFLLLVLRKYSTTLEYKILRTLATVSPYMLLHMHILKHNTHYALLVGWVPECANTIYICVNLLLLTPC